MKNILTALVKDESGQNIVEYALIGTLVVIAAIGILRTLGSKSTSRLTQMSDNL